MGTIGEVISGVVSILLIVGTIVFCLVIRKRGPVAVNKTKLILSVVMGAIMLIAAACALYVALKAESRSAKITLSLCAVFLAMLAVDTFYGASRFNLKAILIFAVLYTVVTLVAAGFAAYLIVVDEFEMGLLGVGVAACGAEAAIKRYRRYHGIKNGK